MAALTRRRPAVLTLLLGALLLAAAWWVAAPATPPLYDGLPLNSEPYRYLQPPAGTQSKRPDPASRTIALNGGQFPAAVLATDEAPPQAQLLINAGGVAVPSGASAVTVSITPVPPARAPASGHIDGNVYRCSATAGGASLQLASGAVATVVLRGTGASGAATMERLDADGWHALSTTALQSNSLYTANTTRLGDFALVIAGSAAGGGGGGGGGASASSGGGAPVAIIVVVAVVVVLAVAVLLVRLRRAGGTAGGRR